MGHDKILKTKRINLNRSVLIISFFCWFIIWLSDTIAIISKAKRYYSFAIHADIETWRGYYSYDKDSVDFYAIVKECDSILPLQEKLQVILPKDIPKRYDFWAEKARYYLYPRNYGDNETPQKYALIYRAPDFQIPAGYKIVKRFGLDKYLIKKLDPIRIQDKK